MLCFDQEHYIQFLSELEVNEPNCLYRHFSITHNQLYLMFPANMAILFA